VWHNYLRLKNKTPALYFTVFTSFIKLIAIFMLCSGLKGMEKCEQENSNINIYRHSNYYTFSINVWLWQFNKITAWQKNSDT
jgi:hypothetical protein